MRQWLLRLPMGYLLGFPLHMGSVGIYLGMAAGNVICAAVTLWIFLRGRWQRVTVADLHEQEKEEGAQEA